MNVNHQLSMIIKIHHPNNCRGLVYQTQAHISSEDPFSIKDEELYALFYSSSLYT